MHNGVFKTLDQVVAFYLKGGGVGLGIKIENQTLPFDSLNLSLKEQKDLIAFIKSLESKIPPEKN
jgi:cytochrome c peroxidase